MQDYRLLHWQFKFNFHLAKFKLHEIVVMLVIQLPVNTPTKTSEITNVLSCSIFRVFFGNVDKTCPTFDKSITQASSEERVKRFSRHRVCFN